MGRVDYIALLHEEDKELKTCLEDLKKLKAD